VIDLLVATAEKRLMAASLLVGFCVLMSSALGQSTPFLNADFEEGELGQTPRGWSVPKFLADRGFTAVLTTDQPQSGKRCAEIRWPAGDTGGAPFANLTQRVDAAPWHGKKIKVTAAIRVASGEGEKRAQMWLRVDRPGGVGAFDNMGNRPVRGQTWADHSITVEVAEDAQAITLGLMALGGVTAWWDNIRVEVVGAFTILKDPPRPLEDAGLHNLVAFTRLLGYVRHFHPTDAAASTDWLRFVIDTLPKIESARDAGVLAAALQAAFQPIAPTVRVFERGREPALPAGLQPPADVSDSKVRFWEHTGYSLAESPGSDSAYFSRRATLEVKDPMSLPLYARPANVFRADVGGGISCWVPTALFADAGGTLPHQAVPAPVADANGPRLSASHRGARLATVMLAWNIFQHFYPYLDAVGTDWGRELEVALRAAATDADEAAFYRTLNRLVVQLHDGHASLAGPGLPLPMPLQARVELVEGQVVVTGAPPAVADLKVGDVVERIEGRPAREVFDEIASYVSAATPQWRDWKTAQQFGPLPPTNPATLEVRGADGTSRTVRVACSRAKAEDAIRHLPKLHEIRPGVFYVDVTRLAQAEFDAALPDLAKAEGLIFEMRGYPSLEPAVWLSHLSPTALQPPLWNVPRTHRPDRTDVEWDTGGRWTIEARQPQLTAHRVFLTDGSAISAAETALGIIEAYKLGPIVGGPSAGTNGEINATDLPLGYRIWWTGTKVLKHDGSRLHGVGIAPTVPVARTIQGIRAGRDEQLQRALSLLE
jgi:C-terminal processing protease CtpA/Prc